MSIWVCINGTTVQNILVPSPEVWFLDSYVKPNWDTVLTVPDGTHVGPGHTWNGDPARPVFTPPPPSLPIIDLNSFLPELYSALGTGMVQAAPYLAVFQDLVQFQNWSGVKTYLEGLVSTSNITQALSDNISALLLSNGIDLSKV